MSRLRAIAGWSLVWVSCCTAQDLPEAQAFYQKGLEEFKKGAFVDAAMSLRSAQRLGLHSAALHDALGIAYYSIHQYTLFLEQMDQATQADAADAAPYHYLGRYYEFNLNNYPLALSYFERALERSPQDVKSLHFRAFCLQMMGRNAEAKAGYEMAIRAIEAKKERFSWSYQKMAELLWNDDLAGALRYAQKAVEIDPERAGNHLMLGKVQEAGGNPAGALQAYREEARLEPNDPAIRYLLFRLYKKLGDTPAATAELRMHERLRQIYGSKE